MIYCFAAKVVPVTTDNSDAYVGHSASENEICQNLKNYD